MRRLHNMHVFWHKVQSTAFQLLDGWGWCKDELSFLSASHSSRQVTCMSVGVEKGRMGRAENDVQLEDRTGPAH